MNEKAKLFSKAERRAFEKRVIRRGSDECWLLVTRPRSDGYGQIKISGETWYAHRLSYELHFGPIPDGLHCLHKCDNPGCVNPAHLFIGTHQDNMRDRDEKGRGYIPTGEDCHTHKLIPAQVDNIRTLYAKGGVTQRQLAKQFGVTQANIWAIVNNKSWRSVT